MITYSCFPHKAGPDKREGAGLLIIFRGYMSKQFNRQRRHNNNRSNRSIALQQITRFTNLDSSGPLGKLRGTPLQLAEKYQAGAKDAQTQGDDVLFQTCQQYADHYLRLQAIALENEQPKIKSEEQIPEDTSSDETEEISSGASESEAETTQEPVIEKRSPKHHKKEDSLSMPMEALQAQSESILK